MVIHETTVLFLIAVLNSMIVLLTVCVSHRTEWMCVDVFQVIKDETAASRHAQAEMIVLVTASVSKWICVSVIMDIWELIAAVIRASNIDSVRVSLLYYIESVLCITKF